MNFFKNWNNPYYSIGYSIIIILAIFFLLTILRLDLNNPFNIYLSIYIQLFGIIFLLSYFFEENNFVFKYHMDICIKKSFPKSRNMAFFYFALATFLSWYGYFQN